MYCQILETMAKKHTLKNKNYIPNEDILIGIVSSDPSYKVCYLMSKIINKNFTINTHYNKDPLGKSDLEKPIVEKTVSAEAFRWTSEQKMKTIFIIPNKQEIEIQESKTIKPSLYNDLEPLVKNIVFLPAWKHIDYVMRFDGFEHDEILEIAEKLKSSKKFQLIVVDQTPQVENAVTLYFFE